MALGIYFFDKLPARYFYEIGERFGSFWRNGCFFLEGYLQSADTRELGDIRPDPITNLLKRPQIGDMSAFDS